LKAPYRNRSGALLLFSAHSFIIISLHLCIPKRSDVAPVDGPAFSTSEPYLVSIHASPGLRVEILPLRQLNSSFDCLSFTDFYNSVE
jgi:hypothetical protein